MSQIPSCDIKVVIKINGQTYVAQHQGPLTLGGDRRKWKGRLVEQIADQAKFITERFTVAEELIVQAGKDARRAS